MRKHWLIIVIASLLAVAGLSACGVADAKTEVVSCDGNVAKEITDTEAELEDAKSDANDTEGTPAESAANDRVDELESKLEDLRACAQPAETTTTIPAPAGTNVVVDPASLAAVFEGSVDPATELAFGEQATATLATAPQERGSAAHSAETLASPQDVVAWFNSGDAKAVVVRDRVLFSVTAACGAEDAARIMAGEGWLTMVVLPPSQITGTSYFKDGQMVFASTPRQTGEKDGYHVPVCLTGEHAGYVVPNAMVRADCGNGSEAPKIRINRPDTPPAPPVEQPPTPEQPPRPTPKCPSGQPIPPSGLCPKDPSKDINNNPWVPDQVTKDHPSDDNQDRIDAGPTTPVDTPSGCPGPCPTTTTSPPSGGGGGPTTTVPVSHGGNTGVTASPTTAPPVAPPVTSSPTTPVTSP